MNGQPWSSFEIRELAACYPQRGAEVTASILGRSVDSVTSMARGLGVAANTRRSRQAVSKAKYSSSVNARFFDEMRPEVAYVLGFLSAGGIKMKYRRVLRIAVEVEREHHLVKLLEMLESRHQIQRYGNRLVVEVGNSYLVDRLVEKFNWPLGNRIHNRTMPSLPRGLLSHFTRGHLHRSGRHSHGIIRLTGAEQHMKDFARIIQNVTDVGEPRQVPYGNLMNVVWADARDVEVLENWIFLDSISSD